MIDQIEKAPRSGDHPVGTTAKCHHLRIDRHATDGCNNFDLPWKMRRTTQDRFGDLDRQLSSRNQDEAMQPI